MADSKESPQNLKNNLKKLAQIARWFEAQKEIDIEEGMGRIREAAELIKAIKKRLKAIENEFEEIKKDLEEESEPEG